MVTDQSNAQEAIIIHEYLTNPDNTIPSISKRLKITPNIVHRVVNKIMQEKKQNIGRS